jgi:pimeloyl-ACP methyl ester carboxylesterase
MKLLLLRGLMREVRHWGEFPEQLAKKKNVEQVLCLDLPGIGKKKDVDYPRNIKKSVKLLREDFLPYSNGDWAILGISLGGMIALEWQNLYPKDFKKAFIVNSSAANEAFLWERLKPKALYTCLASLNNHDAKHREATILQMVSNIKKNDPNVLNTWIKIAEESNLDKQTAIRQLLSAATFFAPKQANIPITFISSKADNMVSWHCSRRLAKRYQSSLILHDQGGHELALDAPNWLADTVEEFL